MCATEGALEPTTLLPPFPDGWYALCLSRELKRGAVQPLEFMGRQIVLYRTTAGAAAAGDAFCPHLGAHLGYGGRVIDETLRCPFHGFRFETDGGCASTPYGTKTPPLARISMLPLIESHGLILAYQGAAAEKPPWSPPQLDTSDWAPLIVKRWQLRGHPQETSENSVDLGHFSQIHGYISVDVLKEAVTDGPYLNAAYAVTRRGGVFGTARAEFDVHVHGLGYSHVDVHVPKYRLNARLFVLATPIDGEQITLRIALSMHRGASARAVSPLLAFVPKPLFRRITGQAIFNGFAHDVEQDFRIWQHKRYVQPPILAAGDGPVGKYRQWARQFYRGADVARV
jgi:phenylpropionate dioxygenase-like ring-hydroxylating dioxygenase large terminal subunit